MTFPYIFTVVLVSYSSGDNYYYLISANELLFLFSAISFFLFLEHLVRSFSTDFGYYNTNHHCAPCGVRWEIEQCSASISVICHSASLMIERCKYKTDIGYISNTGFQQYKQCLTIWSRPQITQVY